ncbi:MAG: DUF3783 domain-containing protein [Ruminococcus sp.]|nr:DUF3783 domain-containing protein [Ruminococcus sp.]
MQQILLYNIDTKKSINIKNICRKLNISYNDVKKEDYGYKLCFLLNLSDDSSIGEGEDFRSEMLFIAGLSDDTLNIFLSMLRKKRCTVELKAVLTETNRNYNSYELYKEISAEHIAMQNGKTLHQT